MSVALPAKPGSETKTATRALSGSVRGSAHEATTSGSAVVEPSANTVDSRKALRAAAEDQKHRALQRWENEGGSFECAWTTPNE
jgi:hypothetical protein